MKSMSRPSSNYPAELRDRTVRMFAEVRHDYTSDWKTAESLAEKLGVRTVMELAEIPQLCSSKFLTRRGSIESDGSPSRLVVSDHSPGRRGPIFHVDTRGRRGRNCAAQTRLDHLGHRPPS